MSANLNNQNELIRFKELLALTGWKESYARKLINGKVLRVFQPTKKVRPMYYRSQIEKLQSPAGAEEQQQQTRSKTKQ